MSLASLPDEFRKRAAMLRQYGAAEQPAMIWELAAKCLDEELEGHGNERLSLADAATESGYTMNSLRRLNRDDKMPIEPDGTVLRRYLPKKPGARVANDSTEAPSSRVQLARTVAGGG